MVTLWGFLGAENEGVTSFTKLLSVKHSSIKENNVILYRLSYSNIWMVVDSTK